MTIRPGRASSARSGRNRCVAVAAAGCGTDTCGPFGDSPEGRSARSADGTPSAPAAASCAAGALSTLVCNGSIGFTCGGPVVRFTQEAAAPEQVVHGAHHLRPGRGFRTGPRDEHQVHRHGAEVRKPSPHRLPQPPLDPVPHDRAAVLLAHYEAHACAMRRCAARPPQLVERDDRVRCGAAAGIDDAEIPVCPEAVV